MFLRSPTASSLPSAWLRKWPCGCATGPTSCRRCWRSTRSRRASARSSAEWWSGSEESSSSRPSAPASWTPPGIDRPAACRFLARSVERAVVRPALDRLDLLFHRDGERDRGRDDVVQVVLCRRAVFRVRVHHGGDDDLLDLRAVPPLGRLGQEDEIELARVATVLLQVDREDLLAFLLVGQVHEEDLVETSLADDFGREKLDPVGRGRDEDKGALLLHPRQEARENARH